jgi:hypothetical protein
VASGSACIGCAAGADGVATEHLPGQGLLLRLHGAGKQAGQHRQQASGQAHRGHGVLPVG